MSIEVVCFDVGETLVNETRLWDGWAAYLGVSRHFALVVCFAPSSLGLGSGRASHRTGKNKCRGRKLIDRPFVCPAPP
jgi:hypothetical protein